MRNRGTYDANDHADADAKQRSGPYKKIRFKGDEGLHLFIEGEEGP